MNHLTRPGALVSYKTSSINFFLVNELTIYLVSNKTPHALFFTLLKTLKWPLLASVFPRLCLIGFNFSQPFLITAAIKLSQSPVTPQSQNEGYGLIGAYILVYVGIAVSQFFSSLNTCSFLISRRYRWAYTNILLTEVSQWHVVA